MSKLSIIFVCYNCGKDIVSAIADIKNGIYPLEKLSIYVVDNASQDDSLSLLRQIKGIELKLIESKDNLGFGAGCNLALKEINDSTKTLLLNPDIHLNADSINNLLAFSLATPDALIWGGKTVDPNGVEDGKNAWKEPSLTGVICWSFFGDILLKKLGQNIPDAYSSKQLENSQYVDAISGCFFLIDTSLFKKLNGFDERFFMYSEEVDLCRRARELGAKPRSTDTAYIIHEGSKTITSQNKLNFLYHSKLKYCKKHWSHLAYLIARISIFCGSILRYAIFVFKGLFKQQDRKEAAVWKSFIKQQLSWKI